MPTLTAFIFITANGYFKGLHDDTSWHRHGEEENAYSEEMLEAENTLLFGRRTYEMMESFWPTPQAKMMYPLVAERMHNADKIVFTNSLKNPSWNNTIVMNGDIIEEIRSRKNTSGKDMALLGSGSILTQFAENELVDEFQIMVDPVIIGQGTAILKDLNFRLDLELVRSKVFRSGVVLLYYKPVK